MIYILLPTEDGKHNLMISDSTDDERNRQVNLILSTDELIALEDYISDYTSGRLHRITGLFNCLSEKK